MHGELNWDYVDQLVECYATLSAYVDQFPEIERQIVQMCETITARRPAMQDFSYLLGRSPLGKEELVRKIAWGSQHIFGARAWCVGQKIILHRRNDPEPRSPLVAQLQRLGYRSNAVDLAHIERGYDAIAHQDRIDAMLVQQSEGTVYIVKGMGYSQARRLSTNLKISANRDSLFGQDGRFLTGVYAQSDAAASLLLARDIINAQFPTLKVVCIFLIIDDIDCGWKYQAHNLTNADASKLVKPKTDLDKFDLHSTHRDFGPVFEQDADAFSSLPKWAASDYLHAAPVDRPTRSIMVLSELWKRQSATSSKLVSHRAIDLAEYVQETYDIEYPTDLWRHDVEDCLERGRFLQRVGAKRNSFALMPKGVARLLLIGRRFNPLAYIAPSQVMGSVAGQAKLWAAASVL